VSLDVDIRRATAEDYGPLCELFAAVDALHHASLPHLFQKPNDPVREPAYYQGLITDENVALLLADGADKVVGFVHAVIRDTPAIPLLIPQRYAVVDSLGVKPELQNRGIGRMLMDAVHDWAFSRGVTTIELNVYEFNQTALAFYHKLGYESLSRKMRRTLNRE